MLRKPLSISRCKKPGAGYLLLVLLCLAFIASCAPKQAIQAVPSYENMPLEQVLAEFGAVRSIEAVLSIEYEKKDGAVSGDAFMNLSEDTLSLRLYYLGFLAGEVSEENGIVKSKPKLDRNKSALLVDGLKNSFFWWNIRDYRLMEREGAYVLKNSYREVVLDRKTMLPVRQTIELENGDPVTILYEEPAVSEEPVKPEPGLMLRRYQSKLTISLKNHIVRVRINSYTPSLMKRES